MWNSVNVDKKLKSKWVWRFGMASIEEGQLPLVDHDSAKATATASSRTRGDEEEVFVRTLAQDIGGPPKPDNFDPNIAARCMYWACGTAYAEFERGSDSEFVPGGLRVGANTLLHSSNELLVNIDKPNGEVLVVFRGTSDLEDIAAGMAPCCTRAPCARERRLLTACDRARRSELSHGRPRPGAS